MNNHANTSDKLMDIDLKWIFKEEIALGDCFNFLAWMLK